MWVVWVCLEGWRSRLLELRVRVVSPEEEMGHASPMHKSPFYCSKTISHSLRLSKSRTNLLEAMNQHWSSNSRENFSCPKNKIPLLSGDVAPGLGSFSVSTPLSHAEGHFAKQTASWKAASLRVSNTSNADLAASQAVNPFIHWLP